LETANFYYFLFSNLFNTQSIDSADSLLVEFKNANYSFVASKAKEAIRNQSYKPKDQRYLILYLSSATDLIEMDRILEEVYIQKDNNNTYLSNAVYLLLERSLVANIPSLGEKWGFRFRQDGEGSTRYADGLYLYASVLYQNKKEKDSLFITNLALNQNPNASVKEKILTLRNAISNLKSEH
jgi:hypothetical protein